MQSTNLRIVAAACFIVCAPFAFAAPAGKVLFSQTGAQILDANGAARAARQGDELATGERLVTPAGAIAQVVLIDGSLLGVRPGSELKFESPQQASGAASATATVSLVQGSLRVIGAELMDRSKVSSVTVQAGLATLKLSAADLESAVIRPADGRATASGESGSYSRLLVGAGSIGNGALIQPLAAREVSFVGQANVVPVTVSSVNPALFNANVAPAAAGRLASATTPVTSAGASLAVAPALSGGTAVRTPVVTAPLVSSPVVTSPVLSAIVTQPSVSVAPTVGAVSVQPIAIAPVVTAVTPVISSPVVTAPIVSSPIISTPVVSSSSLISSSLASSAVSATTVKPKLACTNQVIGGRKVCI